MKTLIFNGSPRPNGNISQIIEILSRNLKGECKVINTYSCDISACIDCRYCWDNNGCALKDGMQDVYDYIQICDNIVIASPIYFSELTGTLLNIGSRLQTYFCANNFRKEKPIQKSKKGAIVLVGGGDGNMNKAYETACVLMNHMNCTDVCEPIFYHNTNAAAAIEDKKVQEELKLIIEFLNEEK